MIPGQMTIAASTTTAACALDDAAQRAIARCAAVLLRLHQRALADEGSSMAIVEPHPLVERLTLSRDGRNLVAAVYLAGADRVIHPGPDCEGIGTDPESAAVSLKLRLSYLFAEV